MTAIIEGTYKHGTIELLEPLPGLQEGRVRVIVLGGEQPKPPACYLTFGKYRSGKLSTLEDFPAAEWHGEVEFDPLLAHEYILDASACHGTHQADGIIRLPPRFAILNPPS